MIRLFFFAALTAMALAQTACRSGFEIRDVDPDDTGEVRSLGPESRDVIRIAEQMSRSLLATEYIGQAATPPTIAMLPVTNNSDQPFNKEIFSQRLRAELNKTSGGRLRFIARDAMGDIEAEREAKREGRVDYDPARRAPVVAGADYLLKGEINSLTNSSRKGRSAYFFYTFKLIDPETAIELWMDDYESKREGKDDVLYR